jgi:hypothetical protein
MAEVAGMDLARHERDLWHVACVNAAVENGCYGSRGRASAQPDMIGRACDLVL